MLCPSCNGDSFDERSSFNAISEPVLGAVSAKVVVDLVNCKRCGVDLPIIRGKTRYTLLSAKRFSGLVADLEEAQRINAEMQGLVNTLERRSHSMGAEIARCMAEGEISIMEERVATLEAETGGLEGRRARLAEALDMIASRTPASRDGSTSTIISLEATAE